MAGTLVTFVAPRALAAGDTDDNISPASTTVVAALKKGTVFTSTGTINGISITVHCTTATFKGKTPAHGLGPATLSAPPTFSGCTDSLHGTDVVKTTGIWTLTFKDAANDETGEKTSGDSLVVTVPKAGATFQSSILGAACKVIVAPNGPAPEAAAYNDAGTAVAPHDSLPVMGQGCSTSPTATVSETLSLTPIIKDVG
jgi:hypothetical protein